MTTCYLIMAKSVIFQSNYDLKYNLQPQITAGKILKHHQQRGKEVIEKKVSTWNIIIVK